MKVRIKKQVKSNRFEVIISTEDFSETELSRIEAQEDPEIQVGGSFTGALTFDLPTHVLKVKSGLEDGYLKDFDSNVFENASAMAEHYATTVKTRIFDAMQLLKDNEVEGFEGESVDTISYV